MAAAEMVPFPDRLPPNPSAGEVIVELEAIRAELEKELFSKPPPERFAQLSRRIDAIDRSLDLWLRWRG